MSANIKNAHYDNTRKRRAAKVAAATKAEKPAKVEKPAKEKKEAKDDS